MHDKPSDRLFALQSYGDDYVVGACAGGRQLVMGLLCPEVVAYFFDAEGNLLGSEARPCDVPPQRHPVSRTYQISDPGFAAALNHQMDAWKAAAGFTPRTIHIKAFVDAERGVGITVLPEYLTPDEIAEEPDPARRRMLEEYAAEWLAAGQFVWWWAKDYFMAADGEVEST